MLADLWTYRSKSNPDHVMLVPVREDVTLPHPHGTCVCGKADDMVREAAVSKTTEYTPRCLFGFIQTHENGPDFVKMRKA